MSKKGFFFAFFLLQISVLRQEVHHSWQICINLLAIIFAETTILQSALEATTMSAFPWHFRPMCDTYLPFYCCALAVAVTGKPTRSLDFQEHGRCRGHLQIYVVFSYIKNTCHKPVDNATHQDMHIQRPNGRPGGSVRVVLAVPTIPITVLR